MIKCIDELLLKFREMIPAVQEQILKWADEAEEKARFGMENFFDSAGRMINAVVSTK